MPAGRPTSYKPEYAELAFKFSLLGADQQRLANFLGVGLRAITTWQEKHPEFARALKKGKDEADAKVADSLYNRARGYTYVEERTVKLKRIEYDEKGKKKAEQEHVEVVPITRRAPPDPTSMIFWLKNRQRKEWRDRVDHTHTGKDDGPIAYEKRVEEAKKEAEEMLALAAERAKKREVTEEQTVH